MSVVIDEMVTEAAEDTTRSAPVGPGGGIGGGGQAESDMDRLDFEMRRCRHRAERLWAD